MEFCAYFTGPQELALFIWTTAEFKGALPDGVQIFVGEEQIAAAKLAHAARLEAIAAAELAAQTPPELVGPVAPVKPKRARGNARSAQPSKH
jgi:hypothetical protein